MEEAKKRDHRTLGRTLKLFSIQEDAGGGLVFWHPKGAVVRKQVEDYWKEEHIKVRYVCMSELCHPSVPPECNYRLVTQLPTNIQSTGLLFSTAVTTSLFYCMTM